MKITRNNYEEFFIDFTDGKLDENLTAEFQKFLEENPDLKNELDMFENIEVPFEAGCFENKASLKKCIVLDNDRDLYFDELCIAKLEGDITYAQTDELNLFLKENSEKNKIFDIYKHTIAAPDLTQIFQYKKRLKHYGIGFTQKLIYGISAAAACTLLFLAINPLFNASVRMGTLAEHRVAQNTGNRIIVNNVISVNTNTENSLQIVKQNNITDPKNNKIDLPENKIHVQELEQIGYTLNMLQTPGKKTDALQYVPVSQGYAPVEENQQNTNVASNDFIPARQFVINKIKTRILGEETDKPLTLITVTEMAVNKLNENTGTNIKLESKYSDEGKLLSLNLESRYFSFSK